MLRRILLSPTKKKRRRRRTTSKSVDWEPARDIKTRVDLLVKSLDLNWINAGNVYCVRSNNSRARAYARIWGMGKVWQITMNLPASYCIEVLSEKFDHLPQKKRDEILLHELAHIPMNFSGSLLPHTHGKGGFHDKLERMIAKYNRVL